MTSMKKQKQVYTVDYYDGEKWRGTSFWRVSKELADKMVYYLQIGGFKSRVTEETLTLNDGEE